MARLTVFLGLLLILSCWAICSSALTTFSLEDKLQELEVRLEEKVTQLEAQLELNNELRQDLALKVIQLEAKNVQLEVKIGKLEAKVGEQDSVLTSLLREKNERTADSVPINNNQSAVAINGLPSSCADLKMIGHTLNGFYSVMGLAMMESIHCDFTKPLDDPGFQKWIGYADVKSASSHFYVQREFTFFLLDNPIITFDLARVNEGNAMDLTTGIFTAPRTGIYFFSFTGLASFLASSPSYVYLTVGLYLNGVQIGSGRAEDSNTIGNQRSPLTLQSTLNLKLGDQVWVQIDEMSSGVPVPCLYDSGYHFTHFTGFMLKEEIVASL